ncbi:MAG: hypothetical protein ACO32J_02455 [Phycisphaerales bacterium]|jgi:hypothetical protein
MAPQQYVFQSRAPAQDGSLGPLGSRREILASLAIHNTSPDRAGGETLYGPGFDLLFVPGEDPVRQILVQFNDEDIAWKAMIKIARDLKWRIADPESGRTLDP